MVDYQLSNSGEPNATTPIAAMDQVGRNPLLLFGPADDSKNAIIPWRQSKQIPDSFVWPHADTHPPSSSTTTTTELLDVPVVDLAAALRDAAGMRDAAAQAAAACASHGFFLVTGHGVDPALARAALDGAAGFFRLPLATKQRARRVTGSVAGYAAAHADRFAANLPWKETLSFRHHHDDDDRDAVLDYFTSTLGDDFKPLGEVYQEYCGAMEAASLAIMEVLGVSLGVGRGHYRDFFADGSSVMRCNYYPPCPEPDRTLGTGPHCDPSALTLLMQDGGVDGLQVLVDGGWRPVRPKPDELVVNIGDTFMVRTDGSNLLVRSRVSLRYITFVPRARASLSCRAWANGPMVRMGRGGMFVLSTSMYSVFDGAIDK
ncbi:hypothetical protein BRADI_2g24980v3 [Brachypodium distachyon]|uniref:Fe2OG dioxygenase domain-containing protein n=1 Tax=Brachypodium distachyon TaxID=15368 RepID=A0A2K2DAC2_BRADI|nr:hypothetical protein BRADI_2g24980v3 [Brachypodium distachyon]